MRGINPIVIIPVVIVLFVLWAFVSNTPTFNVDGARTNNPRDIISLVNSSSSITAGNYDTWESPRGTDYQVPADTTLYISRFIGIPDAAGGATVTIEIGYGDDAVANSASAPTNSVVVFASTYQSVDAVPQGISIWVAIPAEKFPWIRVAGGDYAVQGAGIEH